MTDYSSLLNTQLHFVRWGDRGPRVILIHAIGFDHRSWEPIAPLLREEYQLVALDLPGHGESEKPAGVDYGLRSLGARVVRFMDEMGWEDAILVGNSLGGGTSLAVTLQAPERVRGLALVNSVAFRQGLPLLGRLGLLPLVPLVSCYAPGLAVRLGLESVRGAWGSVTQDRCRACGVYLRSSEGRAAFFTALRALYGQDLDRMSEHYHEIRCPTLVLHGERDPLIRVSHAERLAKTIPGAELVRIPRCGHFAQEERPDVVARELRRFFERVADGEVVG